MRTINSKTFNLLKQLSQEDIFTSYRAVLIGGTALAYHVNHRESFDLDICFLDNKLPPFDFLKKYESEKIDFDNFTKDTIINEGGNIDEFHQKYYINDIKVDFVINVGSNIFEAELLKQDKGECLNNLKIASVDSLLKMKSLLLLDRNKIRDFYDIAYLLKETNYTAIDIISTIKEYRITYNEKDVLRLIKAKQPDNDDIEQEPIFNPQSKDIPTDYESLKKYIVGKLEKSMQKTQNLGMSR